LTENIHGHGQRLGPSCRLAASHPQNPLADRENLAGLFGDRDENVRRNVASCCVFPAQQRLKPNDLAVANVLLRLVDEFSTRRAISPGADSCSRSRRSRTSAPIDASKKTIDGASLILGAGRGRCPHKSAARFDPWHHRDKWRSLCCRKPAWRCPRRPARSAGFSRIRSAMRPATAGAVTSGRMMANSSPLNRAIIWPSPSTLPMRLATA